MTRIAIVVQRCHESIVGGSEALAWQYATLLRSAGQVEVLTTTALNYSSWSNALPAGVELRDGVTIRRFAVTIGRTPYWHELNRRWSRQRMLSRSWPVEAAATRCTPWSIALEEEYLRHQGPYSDGLLDFLEKRQADYQAIIFITYLYPTTYFGVARVDRERCLFVPTLHDEPTAYLKVFRFMAQRVRRVIWLTEQEQKLGHAIWGRLPGDVVGMAVRTEIVSPAQPGYPYLLYSGRIDSAKGCDWLLDYFRRWKEQFPSPVRLVLTGEDHIGLKPSHDVVYRGYVSDTEKQSLMAGASVFVMPSAWESFSAATLEAMAQRTPVLVNGECAVLADHVRRSDGGKTFVDPNGFSLALNEMLADPKRRAQMGDNGRSYVLARYKADQVQERLLCAISESQPKSLCA